MRGTHRALLLAVAGAGFASWVSAAVVNWPATMAGWTKVTTGGGGDYVDALWPPSGASDSVWAAPADRIDIVGGTDLNGNQFTAGFWAVDTVNHVLMFRIRTDNPPSPPPDPSAVWTVLLDTGGNDNVDFALQLDHAVDERVEIGPTTAYGPSSSPPWGNLGDIKVTPQTAVGSIASYARFVDATTNGDGSQFHSLDPGDDDYFTDIAIPLSLFSQVTGLQTGGVFRVAFATSEDHINLNKDKPDGGWSDPITVPPIPEPASLGLMAAAGLLLLRRRH